MQGELAGDPPRPAAAERVLVVDDEEDVAEVLADVPPRGCGTWPFSIEEVERSVADAAERVAPDGSGRRTVGLGRRTVVVADDDAELRHTIGEYLASYGYVVHEAANGLEALTLVKDTSPAFVVLDVVMPRLGGLDALKRIKASHPGTGVVVITGRAEEFREPALARGALQVLEKPVDVAVLLRALGGPAAELPGSQQGRPPLAAPQPPDAKRRARVLVVDDDPRVCEVLTELVAAEGYLSSSVTDGAAAIRAILEQPPDVVLLDIAMPGLNGIDALKTIRTVAPAVQVIMVSGAGEGEAARVCLAYGAFDFISKPVNLPYLAASLEMALVMTHVIP